MRVLDTKDSILSFWQHLVFSEAALLAHPDTAALAAPFTTLLDAFQAVHSGDLATRRATLQAQARSVVADLGIDDGIRALHSDTLSEVRQDREHPIFKALFSSDIGATVRFALARQLGVAEKLVESLDLTLIPAALKTHIGAFGAFIARGREVLEGKRKAAFERTEQNLNAAAWKDDVNAVRQTTYGALLGVAAKARRPRGWVESFFMQTDTKESVDVDTDAPVPTPVEPTPDA